MYNTGLLKIEHFLYRYDHIPLFLMRNRISHCDFLLKLGIRVEIFIKRILHYYLSDTDGAIDQYLEFATKRPNFLGLLMVDTNLTIDEECNVKERDKDVDTKNQELSLQNISEKLTGLELEKLNYGKSFNSIDYKKPLSDNLTASAKEIVRIKISQVVKELRELKLEINDYNKSFPVDCRSGVYLTSIIEKLNKLIKKTSTCLHLSYIISVKKHMYDLEYTET